MRRLARNLSSPRRRKFILNPGMSFDFPALIHECETALRAGRAAEVNAKLMNIPPSAIPRPHRRAIANLLRRIGKISHGLRVLAPVAKEDRAGAKATPHEMAEYAILLQRYGSVREALSILDRVSAQEVPHALLFRAYCHFNRWEYGAAVPHLRSFLELNRDPYWDLGGKLNLAAAHVALAQFAEADTLIPELLDESKKQNLKRIEGNCLELSAQICIEKNDFRGARKNLKAAAGLVQGTGLDELFIRKWTAFANGLQQKDISPIMKFRGEALRQGDSESVREADLYKLKLRFEERDFNHLAFGTPFADYRRRIFHSTGRFPVISHYLFGKTASPCMDLESAKIEGAGGDLKPGSQVHRVLSLLLLDFYRPVGVGAMFAEIYPREHFDIHSSPNRVHHAIRRTRGWLKDNRIPVEIAGHGNKYSLHIRGGFSFRLSYTRGPRDWHETQLENIRRLFPEGADFAAQEARRRLGLSVAAFRRLAKWAVEQGHLERTGHKSTTSYRVGGMK